MNTPQSHVITYLIAWWHHNCETLHIMIVYFITMYAITMFHHIFDYNYGNSRWILIIWFVVWSKLPAIIATVIQLSYLKLKLEKN